MTARRLVPPFAAALLWLAAATPPASGQTLSAPSNPDSASARIEAEAWLQKVDAGDWSGALGRAAPFLRDIAGSAESFGQFVAVARGRHAIGDQRRLAEWEPGYRAVGAPPGEYARLTYTSETGTRETIVLLRTHNGWRVAMYLLNPA